MTLRESAHAAYRLLRLGGVDPLQARQLRNLPRYLRDRKEFVRQGGKIDSENVLLSDFNDASGSASGHYFHQDLLIAQRIHHAQPAAHLDVGSRIDGFVAHVATFREIEIIDIRPLNNHSHPNIRFIQADLMMPLPELVGRYPSVSCLHALEHFGLGRYSDPINVNGHRDGFSAIGALVAPGGTLYVSVPVGRRRVEFNAHRVFAPGDLPALAGSAFTLRTFDYVDDRGNLHRDGRPDEAAHFTYGCGIYTFVKTDSPASK